MMPTEKQELVQIAKGAGDVTSIGIVGAALVEIVPALAALAAAFFVSACESPLSGAGSPLSARSASPVQSAGPRLACSYRDEVLALLERHGESLQSAGITTGRIMAETYANPETGTWTWVLTRPDGVSCMLGWGEGWLKRPDSAGDPEA